MNHLAASSRNTPGQPTAALTTRDPPTEGTPTANPVTAISTTPALRAVSWASSGRARGLRRSCGQVRSEPGEVEAGQGVLGQLDPDQSEPEDLDPDPTLSGRLIPIGLLSGSGQLALAGTAPDLSRVRGAPTPSASDWLAHASRAAQDWASRRSFGLSSACGVSIALAVCAASWFSAGTRTDILRGVGALWAGYLALKAGQLLSAPPQPSRSPQPPLSPQSASSQPRRRGQDSELLAAPAALDIAAPVILEPGGLKRCRPCRDQQQPPAQRSRPRRCAVAVSDWANWGSGGRPLRPAG